MKGEFFRTADLAATLAALVGTEGLDADDALAFRFTGMGERTAWSFDGKGAPAKLVIEFETARPNRRSAPSPGPHFMDALADHADLQADGFRFPGARRIGCAGRCGATIC